jgi:D-alanine transaminase
MRTAYVDGRYAALSAASVSVLDRGLLFADAVYEVWAVRGSVLLDTEGHHLRLARSLAELGIRMPMSTASLRAVLRELMRRNRLRDGLIYLQVGRGVAWPRDHVFPDADTPPSVLAFCARADVVALERRARQGVGAITAPDIRWGRCDIKTVGLLANVLGKQRAREAGAHEVVFVDAEGMVTEGGSTNIWIVDAAGQLRTRGDEANILRGITRGSVARCAESLQMPVSYEAFTVQEALMAREMFMTSASAFVTPIIMLDGKPIGEGVPGPIALCLRQQYVGAATAGSHAH